MVTRIFVFQIKPDTEKDLREWWHKQTTQVLKEHEGFIGIRMRKSNERASTYAFVTDWRRQEDMYTYLKSDPDGGKAFGAFIAQQFSSEMFEPVDQS